MVGSGYYVEGPSLVYFSLFCKFWCGISDISSPDWKAWILDGSPTAMLSFYSWFFVLSRETLSYLAMISQSVFSVWQTLFQLLAHQTRRIEAFHALWCSDPCRYNVPQLFIYPCCIPARGTHRAKSAFFLMIIESKPFYLVHFFLKVGIDTPLTMHIKIGPSSHDGLEGSWNLLPVQPGNGEEKE